MRLKLPDGCMPAFFAGFVATKKSLSMFVPITAFTSHHQPSSHRLQQLSVNDRRTKVMREILKSILASAIGEPKQASMPPMSARQGRGLIKAKSLTYIEDHSRQEVLQNSSQAEVRNLDPEATLKSCKQELCAQRYNYNMLQTALNKMQEERDYLEQEYSKAEGSHTYISNRYHYLVGKYFVPYAAEKSIPFDDRNRDTLDFFLRHLIEDARRAGDFRNQVQMLQHELLAKEKMTNTISDEQFAQDFHKLAAQIKTFSRLISPIEDVNVFEALGPGILASDVACHHWKGRAGRKLFIESWIWSILLAGLFHNPFAIFGMEGEVIFFLWSSMFNAQTYHEWPQATLPCESWRRTTMERLVALVDKDIIIRSKEKDTYLHYEQHMVLARLKIISVIEARVALLAPMGESSQVRQIVDQAFGLAMHMSLQPCRLQLTFPSVGDRFSETRMKNIPSLGEEEGLGDGLVTAVVNPGLTKWGDAHGRNLDHRYDIAPALVQLQTPL